MEALNSGPKTILVDLVRHGESVVNAHGSIVGYNEAELTDLGRSQGRLLGEYYAKEKICFDVAWHSDLPRTHGTLIQMISALPRTLHPRRIIPDRRTIERQHPEWDGRPHAEVYTAEVRQQMKELGVHHRPPGGESFSEVRKRMWSWWDDAIALGKSLPGQPHIVLVGHGHAICSFVWPILKTDEAEVWHSPEIRNTSISRLRWVESQDPIFDFIGQTPHLLASRPPPLVRRVFCSRPLTETSFLVNHNLPLTTRL